MGNQGTADARLPPRRRDRPGRATSATVQEVHVWTNRPFKYWKQAPDIVARPQEPMPIPAHVHWDLFLGTAPERPYNHGLSSPRLARLVGLRHRLAGRHGLPHGQPALHGLAARPAHAGLRQERRRSTPRPIPPGRRSPTSSPPAAACPPVNLTWYEGAKDGKRNLPPEESLPQGLQAVGQRLAAHRTQGPDVLAQRLRRPADALARGEVQGAQGPRARSCRASRAAARTRTKTRSASGSRPSAPASPRSRCRTSTTPRP